MHSSGLLRSEWWQFLTDVSGQPIGPMFKGDIHFAAEAWNLARWHYVHENLRHLKGTRERRANMSSWKPDRHRAGVEEAAEGTELISSAMDSGCTKLLPENHPSMFRNAVAALQNTKYLCVTNISSCSFLKKCSTIIPGVTPNTETLCAKRGGFNA